MARSVLIIDDEASIRASLSGALKDESYEVMTAGSGVAGESGDFSKAVTYTVVKGDSLWKIAQKVYGDGACWPRIQEANKTLLKDSKDLIAGTVLTIPR